MRIAQDWAQPCPNPNCPYHNQFHRGTIIAQSTYQTQSGRRRMFNCTHCSQLFSETRHTVFYDLRLPEETVMLVLKLGLQNPSMIFFEKGRIHAPSRKKSYPQSAKP
jgi:hypothetical protein